MNVNEIYVVVRADGVAIELYSEIPKWEWWHEHRLFVGNVNGGDVIELYGPLDVRSERLAIAMRKAVPQASSQRSLHTGGGVWVYEIDISQDGRGVGPRLWLTRGHAGPGWELGFYKDTEDQGVCVSLHVLDTENAEWVANHVSGILAVLDVVLVG